MFSFAFFLNLSFVILFIILGVVFSLGKGAWLIAGYNTMSHEEKKKYDEKILSKFFGEVMFALAFCWSFVAISNFTENTVPFWIGLSLFFVVIIFAVVYANTGNRFKK